MSTPTLGEAENILRPHFEASATMEYSKQEAEETMYLIILVRETENSSTLQAWDGKSSNGFFCKDYVRIWGT